MIPLLIGAAVGLGKHFGLDKPRENRERKLAAEVTRYSPWTGLQAPPVHNADLFNNVIGTGITGEQVNKNFIEGKPTDSGDLSLYKQFMESPPGTMVSMGGGPPMMNAYGGMNSPYPQAGQPPNLGIGGGGRYGFQ